MFDEPTTGLHFGDIEKLLRALRALVDAGNTVLVVEHNLDVMRASDWLIDLGPEGGDAGGEILVAGTIEDLIAEPRSHTGRALEAYGNDVGWARRAHASTTSTRGHTVPTLQAAEPSARYLARPHNAIEVVHAREHNLKNVSLRSSTTSSRWSPGCPARANPHWPLTSCLPKASAAISNR